MYLGRLRYLIPSGRKGFKTFKHVWRATCLPEHIYFKWWINEYSHKSRLLPNALQCCFQWRDFPEPSCKIFCYCDRLIYAISWNPWIPYQNLIKPSAISNLLSGQKNSQPHKTHVALIADSDTGRQWPSLSHPHISSVSRIFSGNIPKYILKCALFQKNIL